ncbi:MAG: hypothetical protein IT431_08895 [Phycisphaerales bacterium]|nr:hypothetical protein [Phycisphaerales bacterium]
MKGLLGWIKSHLLIVVSTVVILVSLPVGWVFSSGWNKTIREEQEKRANAAYNKVKNAKVTYVIPSLLPDEPAWSESRPPNRVMTGYVKEQREKRLGSGGGIVGEVLAFNRREHALLEPELLPTPVSPERETSLKYRLLARMAGDPQLGERSVYLGMFESIGAGGPPDPVKLATSIQDLRERETRRMLDAGGASQLTPEQTEELNKLLSDRRIAETQRRAKEISVYAGMESFDRAAFADKTAQIPPVTRAERGTPTPPSLGEAFGWNFDYWVVRDIFDAIDLANTDAGGVRANVENALVKRIERLSVERLPVEVKTDPNARAVVEEDEFAEEGAGPVGTDPTAGVTARVSNPEFDVVRVRMTLVMDAASMPAFFDALAETNLMTVTDLDVSEVDTWEDLRQGYFYGNRKVLRAAMEVETVWLRQWTTALMPDDVKKALKIPVAGEEDLEGDG